ncbi:uberolysin/carnocyclin family circular bacteriocin [Gardnerella vaginalis]|uniref:uberolysin/carnocyclin family circular bacteriocin n=1 Tax=Gardnerella vaginalis TaxID=2702 RepID=UPI000E2FE404|nr:uberolysin/carnocyclin family circular bacteriocin [Gardnerella vaginalis]UQA87509.1 uberolysin/carnocyclin family circular bacteriocin [Gardnerella vaginalis]
MLFKIAGTLGVSSAVATSIVSIILTGSTVVSIILGITAILSGGVDAILSVGWGTLVATVKKIVAEKGAAAAAGY